MEDYRVRKSTVLNWNNDFLFLRSLLKCLFLVFYVANSLQYGLSGYLVAVLIYPINLVLFFVLILPIYLTFSAFILIATALAMLTLSLIFIIGLIPLFILYLKWALWVEPEKGVVLLGSSLVVYYQVPKLPLLFFIFSVGMTLIVCFVKTKPFMNYCKCFYDLTCRRGDLLYTTKGHFFYHSCNPITRLSTETEMILSDKLPQNNPNWVYNEINVGKIDLDIGLGVLLGNKWLGLEFVLVNDYYKTIFYLREMIVFETKIPIHKTFLIKRLIVIFELMYNPPHSIVFVSDLSPKNGVYHALKVPEIMSKAMNESLAIYCINTKETITAEGDEVIVKVPEIFSRLCREIKNLGEIGSKIILHNYLFWGECKLDILNYVIKKKSISIDKKICNNTTFRRYKADLNNLLMLYGIEKVVRPVEKRINTQALNKAIETKSYEIEIIKTGFVKPATANEGESNVKGNLSWEDSKTTQIVELLSLFTIKDSFYNIQEEMLKGMTGNSDLTYLREDTNAQVSVRKVKEAKIEFPDCEEIKEIVTDINNKCCMAENIVNYKRALMKKKLSKFKMVCPYGSVKTKSRIEESIGPSAIKIIERNNPEELENFKKSLEIAKDQFTKIKGGYRVKEGNIGNKVELIEIKNYWKELPIEGESSNRKQKSECSKENKIMDVDEIVKESIKNNNNIKVQQNYNGNKHTKQVDQKNQKNQKNSKNSKEFFKKAFNNASKKALPILNSYKSVCTKSVKYNNKIFKIKNSEGKINSVSFWCLLLKRKSNKLPGWFSKIDNKGTPLKDKEPYSIYSQLRVMDLIRDIDNKVDKIRACTEIIINLKQKLGEKTKMEYFIDEAIKLIS